MRLVKAWTAIDRLSVIWKSDFTNEMKHFFPNSSCVDTAIWMHHKDTNKTYGEKNLTATAQECSEQY